MRTLWEYCALSLLLDEKAAPGQVHLPDDLRERMWGYGVRNFLLLPRNVGWLLGANTKQLSLYGYSHTKRAFLEHIISTPGLATSLTSLNLHCNFRVEDDGFACIARCANLESLVLYGCVGLTDSNLIEICGGCAKLTFLDIGECIKVSAAGLVDGVASHLPQLVSLRISATTCDDPVLQSLAKLTQLRSLDVSGCRSDKAVPFELLGALTGLRSLNLNCTAVDDAQLAEIVRRCTELTHLQLSRCAQLIRGETFRQVLTGLPRLESLIASYNDGVSVDSFRAPAPDCEQESAPPMPKMVVSSLTELDVSGCVWITDAALAALCRLLPSLTSLALTKCRGITDWSPLMADARGGLASSLAHLKLNGTAINDAALAVIARGLPALTSLNLMDCRGVTPAGLACFADGAPALQSLKLNWRGYRAALQELRERRPDLHATTK